MYGKVTTVTSVVLLNPNKYGKEIRAALSCPLILQGSNSMDNAVINR